jgi:hypothetical protein
MAKVLWEGWMFETLLIEANRSFVNYSSNPVSESLHTSESSSVIQRQR